VTGRPLVGIAALVCLTSGCQAASTEPLITAWEAVLTPRGRASTLSGSVGAISQGIHTQASIRLRNGAPGEELGWQIRTGSCGDGDAPTLAGRASYPLIQLDSLGGGTHEASLPARLRHGTTYHVVGLSAPPEERVLACGTLVEGPLPNGS
jgi:hypothetical protein